MWEERVGWGLFVALLIGMDLWIADRYSDVALAASLLRTFFVVAFLNWVLHKYGGGPTRRP